MQYLELIILFASCFFGGISIFFIRKDQAQSLKLILSFSGAYLFSITALHLLPNVYEEGGSSIGLFVLGGFLFQVFLEQFSEGIEHGHIHQHVEHFPIGVMLSLCLHAFLEGMPLARGGQHELVFGIALHHIPAAFALGSVLTQHHVKKRTLIQLVTVFSLMTPLGYVISWAIGLHASFGLSTYFNRVMAVVIGIFLHISTTILFESNVDHRFNRKKLMAVLAGVGVSLVNFLLH